MPDLDFVVAGGGLAGACAAMRLARHGSVAVIERGPTSSVGAGLVNPILGLRARPVWRIEEALRTLDETIALAGAEQSYRRGPTLRPALDDEQARRFRQTAAEHPAHCTWLDGLDLDWFDTPLGALRIDTGGAIDIQELTERLLFDIAIRHASLMGWMQGDDEVVVQMSSANIDAAQSAGEEFLSARFLILALGRGYTAFPELMRLQLHQVKGQTIRTTRPSALPPGAPHLAGAGYVASDHDALVCGSTYEHRFADLEPSRRATQTILKKIERMLPSIRDVEVLDERAGVRVTVPGIRLPMVGPVPHHQNVWIFTGLGAKGLLTAPLVAKELPDYLLDPGRIPGEIQVRSVA